MKQLKIFGLSKKHLDVTILPQAQESIQVNSICTRKTYYTISVI